MAQKGVMPMQGKTSSKACSGDKMPDGSFKGAGANVVEGRAKAWSGKRKKGKKGY